MEPRHTGPFKLYAADEHGILLHDVLFAPFFAGAAGPGQIWHWDVYVDRNRLWPHFGRFARMVRGIDPAAERFEPIEVAHPQLRVRGLRGRTILLLWARDPENTWRAELEQGLAPRACEGLAIDLAGIPGAAPLPATVDVYNPWTDAWTQGNTRGTNVPLPAFSRSIVVRIVRGTAGQTSSHEAPAASPR